VAGGPFYLKKAVDVSRVGRREKSNVRFFLLGFPQMGRSNHESITPLLLLLLGSTDILSLSCIQHRAPLRRRRLPLLPLVCNL
jgi:hypothetical protein